MPASIKPMTSLAVNWPAPGNVQTLITTRKGGFSGSPFNGLNLGLHVGDDLTCVHKNWQHLIEEKLPARPLLLNQVHGNRVVEIQGEIAEPLDIAADGAFTRQINMPCAVLTADCLPVLLCDRQGSQVTALHAGWRGLARGIISNGVAAFSEPGELLAYLGPAICGKCFEVGSDVLEVFVSRAEQGVLGDISVDEVRGCFIPSDKSHWLADLFRLARLNLRGVGVQAVYSHNLCNLEDRQFYSYRRDGLTGRFASIIWLSQ